MAIACGHPDATRPDEGACLGSQRVQTKTTTGQDRPHEAALLLLLVGLPLVLGVGMRLARHGLWLNDFDALLCAGWRAGHGANPYDLAAACPGAQPPPYLYMPQLAWAVAPWVQAVGVPGLRLAYGAVHAVVAAFLFAILFVKPMAGASLRLRAPLLALTTVGARCLGNIAYLAHALVLGAALARRRAPWLLVATIVAVSAVKPVFLGYLLIFAYEQAPLQARARRIGMGLVLALCAAGLVALTGGSALLDWKAALDQQVVATYTGVAYLNWAAHLGLRAHDLVTLAGYAVFVGAVCLSGLAICEVRGLDREARLFLAVAAAQFVNPRLMSYDLVMLAPLAIAFCTVPPPGRNAFGALAFGAGLVVLGLHFAGLSHMAIRVGPLLYAGLFLTAGAWAGLDAARVRRPVMAGA